MFELRLAVASWQKLSLPRLRPQKPGDLARRRRKGQRQPDACSSKAFALSVVRTKRQKQETSAAASLHEGIMQEPGI